MSNPATTTLPDPRRLMALRSRTIEVLNLLNAVMPSVNEIAERAEDLVLAPNPWQAQMQRASLTSVAARLAAGNQAVLGLLGQFDLLLADRDELAASMADRGLLLPGGPE